MMEEMENQWHEEGEKRMEENIVQVKLYSNADSEENTDYTVDFPDENVMSLVPANHGLNVHAVIKLSDKLDKLELKRKAVDGEVHEGREFEEQVERDMKKVRGSNWGEGVGDRMISRQGGGS